MRTKSKKGKKGEQDQSKAVGLKVVLAVLVVAIVGLIGGVVVVHFNKIGNNNQSWDCEKKETLYDIGVCIEDAYDSGVGADKISDMYRESVELVKKEGNYKLAADLLIQRTSSMALMGECEKAMDLLKQSDFDGYNDSELLRMYSYAVGTSASCDDRESFDYWNALLSRVNEEVTNESF